MSARPHSPPAAQAPLYARVARALRWRERLGFGAETTGYRLLNGAGDGVPGLVADRFGEVAVVRAYDGAAVAHLPAAAAALRDEGGFATVLGQDRSRRGAAGALHALAGELPPLAGLEVRERGLVLAAFFGDAGKPGVYFDQRETRAVLEEDVARLGAPRVLNLFAFTGAFSLAAARAGAGEVSSVDATRGCAEAAARNFERNGLDAARHTIVAADAFAYLRQTPPASFDVVVCDPPTFATTKASRLAGGKDLERLLGLCARALRPGGTLIACSNDARMGLEPFAQLAARGIRAGASRTFRLRRVMGLPADHPTAAGAPKERYLKVLVGTCDV